MTWKCDKCGKKFKTKKKAEKHEKSCTKGKTKKKKKKNKSDGKNEEKDKVKEYKRKCNECGKVWHSLVSREKKLSESETCSNCVQGFTACGGNLGAATQAQRNADANSKNLEKLRKCPKCGSRNYEEEVIIYEKK